MLELKKLCLKLLLAMVEGTQTDAIPRRIVFSLDLGMLALEMDSAYMRSTETADESTTADEREQFRELGFYFFLLMRTLARFCPQVNDSCEGAASFPFFHANTGTIEIVRADKSLEDVLFPVPTICKFLSQKSKDSCMWEVDRSTPQKRVEDFIKRSDGLIHEMHHNQRISQVRSAHAPSGRGWGLRVVCHGDLTAT